MKIQLSYKDKKYSCDLSQPMDLSISVGDVRCFYSTEYNQEPYESGDFVGAVRQGAPVNFFDVELNPHGNGTHTECLGHITYAQESINNALKTFHHFAQLVSVDLHIAENGDQLITKENLKRACPDQLPPAIIIRTLPNDHSKLTMDYSGTNPPYVHVDAMQYLVDQGVEHLLIDLPSVDREVDEGKLLAHHLFWNVKKHEAGPESRNHNTITELIYADNSIPDGFYLLNIQIPTMQLDAAPSKPVIYALQHEK